MLDALTEAQPLIEAFQQRSPFELERYQAFFTEGLCRLEITPLGLNVFFRTLGTQPENIKQIRSLISLVISHYLPTWSPQERANVLNDFLDNEARFSGWTDGKHSLNFEKNAVGITVIAQTIQLVIQEPIA